MSRGSEAFPKAPGAVLLFIGPQPWKKAKFQWHPLGPRGKPLCVHVWDCISYQNPGRKPGGDAGTGCWGAGCLGTTLAVVMAVPTEQRFIAPGTDVTLCLGAAPLCPSAPAGLPAPTLASPVLMAHLTASFCLSCANRPRPGPGPAGRGSVVCGGGWRGPGWVWDRLTLLLSVPSACCLGCKAALSRLPSCTLHFSVWREAGAVIHLAGALRARDAAQLPPAAVGAGASSPSPASPPAPAPSRLPAAPLSTHPAP